MAKAKAERWLTESFAAGVWERDAPECWLARFDPAGRPCSGRLEVAHFIGRQRVENALGALLRGSEVLETEWKGGEYWRTRSLMDGADLTDFVLLAAWDPRNGGLACEGHHRRFDDHAVSLPRDRVIVPYSALPSHVVQFAFDYGLEQQLDKFPSSI